MITEEEMRIKGKATNNIANPPHSLSVDLPATNGAKKAKIEAMTLVSYST